MPSAPPAATGARPAPNASTSVRNCADSDGSSPVATISRARSMRRCHRHPRCPCCGRRRRGSARRRRSRRHRCSAQPAASGGATSSSSVTNRSVARTARRRRDRAPCDRRATTTSAAAATTARSAHHGRGLAKRHVYFLSRASDSKYFETSGRYASGTRSLPPPLKRSSAAFLARRAESPASYRSSARSTSLRSDSQRPKSCLNASLPGADRLHSCCSGVAAAAVALLGLHAAERLARALQLARVFARAAAALRRRLRRCRLPVSPASPRRRAPAARARSGVRGCRGVRSSCVGRAAAHRRALPPPSVLATSSSARASCCSAAPLFAAPSAFFSLPARPGSPWA